MIDPWGNIEIGDYEKVFTEFGLSRFPNNWASKLSHYLFTRNIIIAHRDFDKVMQRIEEKKPFIQMTGIASSGKLHFGHKINLDLFKFFKTKGARTYLCVANIDAYVSRPKIQNMDEAKEYAVNNLAHILAYGFKKEDVYLQSKKDSIYYTFSYELSKRITEAMFRAVYGHLDLGKAAANMLQYADILHPQLKKYEGKMPSVTPIGLDQDPHARVTRDIAKRVDYDMEMPGFLYFRHQGGLQQGMKMSSSEPLSAIFLDDNAKDVKYKIERSFTGGRDTLEEQKKKGGNPDICRIYDLYRFHNPDDKLVVDIYAKCKKGKILCKECKEKCVNFLNKFLSEHQKKVKKFLPIARKIVFE